MVWNPFENIFGFLYVLLAILISGICIYYFNVKVSFKKIDIAKKDKKKIALILAIFTAPYLFFYPSSLIYSSNYGTNISDGEPVITNSFDNFIKENKGTYLGDNNITRIFDKSGNFLKTNKYEGYIIDHSYQIDTKNLCLVYELTLSTKLDINNNEHYMDLYNFLEQCSIITMALSNNTEKIIVNIRSGMDIKNIEFLKEDLSKKYAVDLSTLADDISLFKSVLIDLDDSVI